MQAPDKIYLQACGDCPGFDSCQSCKFDDLGEVTWSEEKVWEKDIPYIRKDALLEWLDYLKGKVVGDEKRVLVLSIIDKLNSL